MMTVLTDLKTKFEVVQYNLELLKKSFSFEVSGCSMDEDGVTSLYLYCYPNGVIDGMGYIQDQTVEIRSEVETGKMYSVSLIVAETSKILSMNFGMVAKKDKRWIEECLLETKEKYNQSLK